MSDTVLSISQEQRKTIAEKEQAHGRRSARGPVISVAVFIVVMKHNQKELGGKGLFALLFHIVAHH